MKIAYLINYAGAGGSEKYVKLMIDAVQKRNHDVVFIYNEKGALSEWAENNLIKCYRIEMKNPFDIKASIKLAEICRKEKIDLVHVQFPRENYIAIFSKLFTHIKIIYTCHLIYEPQFTWRIFNRFFTPFDKNIIAVSGAVKKKLIRNGISEKKIKVIYNGIIPQNGINTTTNIRNKYGISEKDFLCVVLARYTAEKGLDFLVNSFSKLKGKAKCIILGEGPLFDDIKELIYRNGLENSMIQAGYQNNVFDYLLSSDLLLNSSSSEAFSFAILEGMAASLPVVATDVGGNREMLKQFLECGEIVQYGDEEGFANSIEMLKKDKMLYETYAKNAFHNLQNKFHQDLMIKKTLDLYETETLG
ncbi:MAG: glycosyltransferase [Schaedlerella sp.]|nr:glycosyltransferase [Schaedlerella sp.]